MKSTKTIACSAVFCFLSLFTFSASANDLVCNNLKSIIHHQKQTYAHYQDINHNAHLNIKHAKRHINANTKLIATEKEEVAKLAQRLKTEQEHLAYTSKRLEMDKHRVQMASKHLKEVPADVLVNEQRLIAILTDKYRDICLMRNPDDPAQGALVLQFYP